MAKFISRDRPKSAAKMVNISCTTYPHQRCKYIVFCPTAVGVDSELSRRRLEGDSEEVSGKIGPHPTDSMINSMLSGAFLRFLADKRGFLRVVCGR